MGQEADADEQLRRRLRRVFAAEERSFRMDRRSRAAAALCSAVADVLPRFLGNYSDDTLAEYIVILVCNGKHQYQARDDLEAFLGDDSAKFVAWLWGYLSKKAVAPADNCDAQHGLANESQNLDQHGDVHIVSSKILPQEHHGLQTLDSTKRPNVAQRRISSVIASPERLVGNQCYWENQHPKVSSKILPQEHHGLQTLDSTKRPNVAQRRISSVIASPERLVGNQCYWEDQHPKVNSKILPQEHHGLQTLDSAKRPNVAQRRISSVIASPERLVGNQCYWEDQHPKKVWSATGGRSSSIRKSGIAARTAHALTQEEPHDDEHLGRNTPTGYFPVAVGTDDGEVPESTKRRRNVWDRLGKPAEEDQGLARETDNMRVENKEHKKTKLMVAEHEQRCYVSSSIGEGLFDKANSRKFSGKYPDINTVQEHEHTVKSNGSRLIGRLSFGDVERNRHEVRDVNELTSAVKSSPAAVSGPAWHATNKLKDGHASASDKLAQLTMRINSGSEVLQTQKISSPLQSKSGSSLWEDGGNLSNKPVKDEMLNVKLKLKQIELDMLKLRSKQAQINNGNQGSLPSGPLSNLEEDAESRTVLVTNVHFAATKEALSTHFMKCGTVLKINVLTDAITGRPKGAAYITFADKESIGRAISLSGTSFLSRVLTVMRKAEAPPGFVASVQQTGRPFQPWNSPPFQKGVSPMQSTTHHLQWKREQSALEHSPANCPTN